jgi:DNA-binding beta-propeller fold protein YncE
VSIVVFLRSHGVIGTLVAGLFFSTLNAQSAAPIALPGQPFGVVDSPDGQWVFVSLANSRSGETSGLAVLRNRDHQLAIQHIVKMSDALSGLALTHDGSRLVAIAGDTVLFFDTQKLTAGEANPVVQRLSLGANVGGVCANITADDQTLFVSDEAAGTITVINMTGLHPAEKKVTAVVVGEIPVGLSPLALVFSPDERWLYVTCEVAPPDWHWPEKYKSETNPNVQVPEGAIMVVDVARAKKDPSHGVVTKIPAGGSPVRSAISPTGDRLFVVARNSNAVFVFDPAKFSTDPAHAQLGVIPVGAAPVPIAIIGTADDLKVVVGNSNRFGPNANRPSTLTVIAPAKTGEGVGAVLGTIPAGAFPRELRLSHDGHTLFLTNALSDTLQVMDAQHLPMDATSLKSDK